MLRIKRSYLPCNSLLRTVSFLKAYRIEESDTRGKIAVAVRDVKQGEQVLEEKEPILFFPDAYDEYKAIGMDIALPAFRAYMRETPLDKQRKLLTLFGPTTGKTADNMRNNARNGMQFRFKEGEEKRWLTPEEVEIFVKVAQVTRMNIFGGSSGYSVFEDITRFAHSCDSNCAYVIRDKNIACYAKRFIHAGEELTISYVASRDIEPTHERRHKYLEVKEFTCHCPRCDALGDDTRQFACFDPTCNGVMMIRQPINKKEIRVTNLPYTGLAYEEPHLLPCTVCHCTAPTDYQARMLHIEAQLPILTDALTQSFEAILRHPAVGEIRDLLQLLLSKNFPRRHAASLPLLKLEWHLKHMLFVTGEISSAPVRESLSDYFACLESVFPYPHSVLSTALTFVVGVMLGETRLPSPFLPQQEKELCQKALRMQLILNGRDKGHHLTVDATLRALEKLPPDGSTEVCAFCAESLVDAPFLPRLCSNCKQVVYCSAGCQKAHWPLHKKTCQCC